jgi:heterotetrameric sarcosine oxidase gamma subunit
MSRLPPPEVCLVQIHGDLPRLGSLVDRALGVSDRGRTAISGPRAYVIGPAEWLVFDESVEQVRHRLIDHTGPCLLKISDFSGAFSTLRVAGQGARALLASDIGAPGAVAMAQAGDYVRTRLAQVDLLLHRVGSDSFDLHVDRSVGDYLQEWLMAQHGAHCAEGGPAASVPGPKSSI